MLWLYTDLKCRFFPARCTPINTCIIEGNLKNADIRDKSNARLYDATNKCLKHGTKFTESVLVGPNRFVAPEMVILPKGTFRIGQYNSPDPDETPMDVIIDRHIAVGVHEVTVGEFEQFVREEGYSGEPQPFAHGCSTKAGGERPRPVKEWDAKISWEEPGFKQSKSGRQPVVCVNWHDANKYIDWLNKKLGLSSGSQNAYRLLSEAEWEYAARGITDAKAEHMDYFFGKEQKNACEHGNVQPQDLTPEELKSCKQEKRTYDVGGYQENKFHVRDMHGNVREWVEDCYTEEYKRAEGVAVGNAHTGRSGRCSIETANSANLDGLATHPRVVRGSSWSDFKPRWYRVANRHSWPSNYRRNNLGFRLARSLPQ